MFVESQLEDTIKLYASNDNKIETIKHICEKKYANKHIQHLGLGIQILGDISIITQVCVESYIVCTIRANILFFRFMRDEILECRIMSQTEEGIFLTIEFFDKIFVSKEDLPDISEITYVFCDETKTSKKLAWVWVHKGNRFVLKDNEKARVRIQHDGKASNVVRGSFTEPGLGPVSWWE